MKYKDYRYHYSGVNSRKFWRRINKIKSEQAHEALFSVGVILQNLEGDVLNMLRIYEEKENN